MKSFIIFLIVSACLLHAAFGAPQLITFKDGKVGVNFFGYHAEAGLGGQNSGNGLAGGLHASAGTPWGQNAAAGLGGNVNGRAAGGLYAGAQALPDVGASAVLGGDTSKGGYGASEAYVPGKVSHRSHNVQFEQATQAVLTNEVPVTDGPNVIQKVKSKRYRGDAAHQTVLRQRLHQRHPHPHQQRKLQRRLNNAHQERQRSKTIVRTVEQVNVAASDQQTDNHGEQLPYQAGNSEKHIRTHKHKLIATTSADVSAAPAPPAPVKVVSEPAPVNYVPVPGPVGHSEASADGYIGVTKSGNVVPAALQIPIGILQSLQQSLGGLGGSSSLSVSKYH
ncbi:uncharacterized protein LOC101899460 isoform X2 [Musca domestica]|uniref:Uncharacterized protein LOC101899460 n=1 Tax=Musca domestica TaxID=7370 RepID=A0A1I8M3C1_MUSDO|nr:uncharacterized protein LOC101899460 isoform X2 [Musca domestica]